MSEEVPVEISTHALTTPGIGMIIGLCIIICISLVIIRLYVKKTESIRKATRFIFFIFLLQTIFFWGTSFFITDIFKLIHTIFFKIITTATILSGALYINQLINYYIWGLFINEEGKSEIPSFLKGMANLIIYILAIATIVKFIFVKDEGALITLIGGVALLLGYAAKEIIAHVFAALALNITPSFKKGDVIIYDKEYLHIEDMNWRFVTFIDPRNNRYFVPNSHLTDDAILNFSSNNGRSKIKVKFDVDLSTEPQQVIKLLSTTLRKVRHYNAEEKVEIFVTKIHSCITFMVHFPVLNIRHSRDMHELETEVFLNIWNTLKENNISFYINPFYKALPHGLDHGPSES